MISNSVHFITYGDGRYEFYRSAIRLCNQATKTGWFSSVTRWTSLLLGAMDPQWMSQHENQMRLNPRGHGYWIWKPKIIQMMLAGLPEGDVLVYMDAGNEINPSGIERFNLYLELVIKAGFVFFYLNGSNVEVRQWTKAALLKRFGITDSDEAILKTPQMESGVLLFHNTQATRDFVAEWARVAVEQEYVLINDALCEIPEKPSFMENRHDQAILSLLFLTSDYGMAIRNENYFLELWEKGAHPKWSPVATFRNLEAASKMENLQLSNSSKDIAYLWSQNKELHYLEQPEPNLHDKKLIAAFSRPFLLEQNTLGKGGPSGDGTHLFKKLEEKTASLNFDSFSYEITLMNALLSKNEKEIASQLKDLKIKEAVIQEQRISLNDRLSAIFEKQAVIEEQKNSLENRLDILKQNAEEFKVLRNKIEVLEKNIVKSNQQIKLYEEGYSFKIRILYQLRIIKHKVLGILRSVKRWLLYIYRSGWPNFLHTLRVIKHRIKYLPGEVRYHYDVYYPQLQAWWRGLYGNHLGNLRLHKPQTISLPKSYANPQISEEKKDLPKISIITPAFRHGKFIERTIQSILSQNYPNLEYIIQDGGSDDETIEVVRPYLSQLASFQSAKDRGQSHAINLGMGKSTGEILAWVNSDDILLPGALKYVGKFFAKNPEIDVIYGHRVLINENDQQIGRWILPKHSDDILSWVDYVPQETLFWRRRLWRKVGEKIDESFQFAMDWDLLLRFRKAGGHFYRVPRIIGGFRVHPEQKTSSQINNLGNEEMAHLRKRNLGYEPSGIEILNNVKQYLARHRLENMKWRVREVCGLL